LGAMLKKQRTWFRLGTFGLWPYAARSCSSQKMSRYSCTRERTPAVHRSLIRCAISRRMSNSDGTDESGSSCTLTETNLSDPSGAVSR